MLGLVRLGKNNFNINRIKILRSCFHKFSLCELVLSEASVVEPLEQRSRAAAVAYLRVAVEGTIDARAWITPVYEPFCR